MLIKCPECKREISDQSKICIHCGYPTTKTVKKSDVKVNDCECPLCKQKSHVLKGIEDTCAICGYVFNFEECKNKNPNWKLGDESQSNIPHCPTCNSTNIKRISTTAKVTNIAMFGLLGNKRKKTFHCNNCKYEW